MSAGRYACTILYCMCWHLYLYLYLWVYTIIIIIVIIIIITITITILIVIVIIIVIIIIILNSPVPGEVPAQRPVTRSFDVFFDLHPNKRLCKQWWGWCFETPPCPLRRHRNETCSSWLQHFGEVVVKRVCKTSWKIGQTVFVSELWNLHLIEYEICRTFEQIDYS